MPMIQRLAISIYESMARMQHLGGDAVAWADLPDDQQACFRIAAAKVLVALRGPTRDMLADGNADGFPMDAGNVWERMIFRALYPKTE